MPERRAKRSPDPHEALQLLLESVTERGEARALALVNGRGRILVGTGAPGDVGGLARLTGMMARGEDATGFDELTRDAEFSAKAITVGETTAYLAALGAGGRPFDDAIAGISRIVASR